jgi:hypothetical protein
MSDIQLPGWGRQEPGEDDQSEEEDQPIAGWGRQESDDEDDSPPEDVAPL